MSLRFTRFLILVFVSLLSVSKGYAADLLRVSAVAPNIIMLELKDGHVDYTGFGEDKYTRDLWGIYHQPVDLELAVNLSTYSITSNDDAWGKVSPIEIGRKSMAADYTLPNFGQDEFIFEHSLFLKLPQQLVEGQTYTVDLGGLVENMQTYTFTFDAKTTRSEAVHVNQVGYGNNARKIGYLSQWLGDMGHVPLKHLDGEQFHIVNYVTKEIVYEGQMAFRLAFNETTTKNNGTWGTHANHSYADIVECDFSAFGVTGEYVLSVPGIGCSFPFEISREVVNQPFYTAMRGLFMQRAGVEKLLSDGTIYKRGHHPDDVPHYYDPNYVMMGHHDQHGDKDNHIEDLMKSGAFSKDYQVKGIWGWYHDASDWDSYVSHMKIPLHLFLLYEMYPDQFYDGEIGNKYRVSEQDEWIDEGTNGIPDILDEAAWLVHFYKRAKEALLTLNEVLPEDQKTSGGVPGYIGREGGAPGLGLGTSYTDTRDWAITGENYVYTMGYSAMAAWYAHCLDIEWQKSNTGHHPEYQMWLTEAEEAFGWSRAHGEFDPEDRDQKGQEGLLPIAAYQLYRATKDSKYLDLIKEGWYADTQKGWSNETSSLPYGFIATSLIANAPADYELDAKLVSDAKSFQQSKANYVANLTEKIGFRYGSFSPDNYGLGMFATPKIFVPSMMHKYADVGNDRWLKTVEDNVNYVLGGNQANKIYISQLGERPQNKGIHHLDSWAMYDHNSMVYGWDPVEGLVTYYGSPFNFNVSGPGNHFWAVQGSYPDWKQRPRSESNYPSRESIAGSEFTTQQTIASFAYATGILKAEYGQRANGSSHNDRPTVSLIIGGSDVVSYKDTVSLMVNASADTRRVDYYYDWHLIGSSEDAENKFKFDWVLSQSKISEKSLITARAFDDRGLSTFPSADAEQVLNVTDIDFLKVTPSLINLEGKTESQKVVISAKKNWTLTQIPEWVSANIEEGAAGETEVSLTFSANESGESRTAEIIFSGSDTTTTLTVDQAVFTERLSVDLEQELSFEDQWQLLAVNANIPWEAEVDQNWIRFKVENGDQMDYLSEISGTGDAEIEFKVDENLDAERRTANITFTSAIGEQVFEIDQMFNGEGQEGKYRFIRLSFNKAQTDRVYLADLAYEAEGALYPQNFTDFDQSRITSSRDPDDNGGFLKSLFDGQGLDEGMNSSVFDTGDFTHIFLEEGEEFWVTVDMGNTTRIRPEKVWFFSGSNAGKAPERFTLEGSNDQNTWDVIMERADYPMIAGNSIYRFDASLSETAAENIWMYASAPANGDVLPDGYTEVQKDGEITYQVVPHDGYRTAALRLDDEIISAAPTYTFENIQEAHHLEGIFAKDEIAEDDGDFRYFRITILEEHADRLVFPELEYMVNDISYPNPKLENTGTDKARTQSNYNDYAAWEIYNGLTDKDIHLEIERLGVYWNIIDMQEKIYPTSIKFHASERVAGKGIKHFKIEGSNDQIFWFDIFEKDDVEMWELGGVYEYNTTSNKVTINASVINNEGGTISPEGEVSIQKGSAKTFTFTPAEGYEVHEIFVDGAVQPAAESFQLINVEEETDIAVSFRQIPTFELVPALVGDGQISPNTVQNVGRGGEMTFLFEAAENARLKSVEVDGQHVGTDPFYTFTNIQTDHEIKAIFEPLPEYTIQTTIDEHGSLIPNDGDLKVREGEALIIHFEADSAYRVKEVLVDGVSYKADARYTFVDVQQDHTFEVKTEAIPIHVITATSDANSWVLPAGATEHLEGTTSKYTFGTNPGEGFRIKEVFVDDVLLDDHSSGQYEFANIQQAHSIAVNSEPIPVYTLTASAGENGSITDIGETQIYEGQNKTYQFFADAGFEVDKVYIDDKVIGEGISQYVFKKVMGSHKIHATFKGGLQPPLDIDTQKAIRVYPNPAKNGRTNVACIRPMRLAIYNTQGQLVQQLPEATTFENIHLPAGVYIFKLIGGNEIKMINVIY